MTSYVASMCCFIAAMVAFTAAGEARVLVISPLGLAGPVLALGGVLLAARAIKRDLL